MIREFQVTAAGCGRDIPSPISDAYPATRCGVSFKHDSFTGRVICPECNASIIRLNVLLADYTVTGLENAVKHAFEDRD